MAPGACTARGFDGAWALDAPLDPVSGAVVAKALGRIEQEPFEADWAEAHRRVGDRVCAGDLARTPASRFHNRERHRAPR